MHTQMQSSSLGLNTMDFDAFVLDWWKSFCQSKWVDFQSSFKLESQRENLVLRVPKYITSLSVSMCQLDSWIFFWMRAIRALVTSIVIYLSLESLRQVDNSSCLVTISKRLLFDSQNVTLTFFCIYYTDFILIDSITLTALTNLLQALAWKQSETLSVFLLITFQ